MGSELVIRTAVADDLPELQRIFEAAALSNVDDAPVLRAHPEFLIFAGDGIADGRTRVAVSGDDRVLGFATVALVDGVPELEDLFVDPEFHRRGVARGLMHDAVTTARAAGHRRMTVVGNSHALDFYRAVGFVETGPASTELGTGIRMRLDL